MSANSKRHQCKLPFTIAVLDRGGSSSSCFSSFSSSSNILGALTWYVCFGKGGIIIDDAAEANVILALWRTASLVLTKGESKTWIKKNPAHVLHLSLTRMPSSANTES